MATSKPGKRDKTTLVSSIEHMFVSGELADMTFVFGGNTSNLHAHKLVLGMRSPVFKAMLYGPLSDESAREIYIEDVEPDIFKTFLRYLYTDDIGLDGSCVFQFLYLANKYSLETLEDTCCTFLRTGVTVENVFTIYEHADWFCQHDLQKKCFDFITEHVKAVFKSKTFLSISKETLGSILASDNLSADEKCVFDAAVSWAKHKCKENQVPMSDHNIRQQLGDNFYHIRFPIMSKDVFTIHICKSKILFTEEKNALFRFIATKADYRNQLGNRESTNSQDTLEMFTSRPRKGTPFVLNLTQMARRSTLKPAYINRTRISFVPPFDLKIHSVVFRDKNTKVKHIYMNSRFGRIPFYTIGNTMVFNDPVVLKPNVTCKIIFVHEHDIFCDECTTYVNIQVHDICVNFTDIVQELHYSL